MISFAGNIKAISASARKGRETKGGRKYINQEGKQQGAAADKRANGVIYGPKCVCVYVSLSVEPRRATHVHILVCLSAFKENTTTSSFLQQSGEKKDISQAFISAALNDSPYDSHLDAIWSIRNTKSTIVGKAGP